MIGGRSGPLASVDGWPMKVVFVLFDSLNRHALGCYGGPVATPNFDRLAARSVVFDRHFVGSLPCMPARRDIQTGRLNFLHRGWGPLEPFDRSIADLLGEHGIYTHLITDHYHYFEDGGTGFHGRYASWDFIRGQEKDKWQPRLGIDRDAFARRFHESQHDFAEDPNGKLPYYVNRDFLERKGLFPLEQCFDGAVAFADQHHGDDNWFLHLECFDPHEPFFAPERFLGADAALGGKIFDWPSYGRADVSPDLLAQLRGNYDALLRACDEQLGRLLDAFDRHDLWADTWLILSTDHGLLLGERELLGKNRPPFFNEVAQIPLLITPPRTHGAAPRRTATLSQTIDLMPTFCEIFGLPAPAEVEGRSLVRVLKADEPQRGEAGCLYGQFGAAINFTDGRYTYFRYPLPDADELNQYTLMPMNMRSYFEAVEFGDARAVAALPFTRGYPLWRLPVRANARANMTRRYPLLEARTVIYDLDADPAQTTPVDDPALEARLVRQLVALMQRNHAPAELYRRYGLSPTEAVI